jgi:abortive infection bacteriophage resistance protein
VDKCSIIWAICVGIVVDSTGIRKLRIAKGKIKGKVFKNVKGELQYELYDKNDPIAQVNRFNITDAEDWQKIKKLVDKWIPKLK